MPLVLLQIPPAQLVEGLVSQSEGTIPLPPVRQWRTVVVLIMLGPRTSAHTSWDGFDPTPFGGLCSLEVLVRDYFTIRDCAARLAAAFDRSLSVFLP